MADLTPHEIETFLSSIAPFKALAPAEVKHVASVARPAKFAKDETVYNEGDPADSVWVLQAGRIQVFKYTSGGKPFAIESLGDGELFGTLCRMGANGRSYPCTAVAAGPTVAIRIPEKVFLSYYLKNHGFIRGLCSLCSDRLKDVQDLRCMGQESVEVRMASTLLRLRRVHGDTIPFTKKEVSELIGATLETTFRTLSDLEKKGLLESLRGGIKIKKAEKLEAIARC
jgi:CRP/FNR family transcriptional regulator, nitrogen oxide reductase regulator